MHVKTTVFGVVKSVRNLASMKLTNSNMHQVLGTSDEIAQPLRQATRQSLRREEFLRERGEFA